MSSESPKCHVCGADRPVSSRAIEGHCGVCGAILPSEPDVLANSEESFRYIQKARNSGNAAEAYEYCCQALRYDSDNAIAWAERFRVSFWLNSELRGNLAKTVLLDEQLKFLEKALQTPDEEAQYEVARIIIQFYISESVIDQHIRLHPTDEPRYVVRFQEFIRKLPAAMQTRLQEELIYLTGEALNKSLAANCRSHHKRQNFLSLCACLTLPMSMKASPLYIRIYETLEVQIETQGETTTDVAGSLKRSGFMCLISSDSPQVSRENKPASNDRTGPDYKLSDWPAGVQIVSNRIPEKLLSTWLVQWFFAYQSFLGINTRDLAIETYDCLGNPEELPTALEAFSQAMEVSFSAS
jgi:tetratricopeptide (TPR) repeat protein